MASTSHVRHSPKVPGRRRSCSGRMTNLERCSWAPCGGVGGGFGGACGDCDGERPLSTTAINFGPVPLNKYVRFRNGGAYTCIASSADVATPRQKIRCAPPCWCVRTLLASLSSTIRYGQIPSPLAMRRRTTSSVMAMTCLSNAGRSASTLPGA